MSKQDLLDHAELLKCLSYDATTGHLTWTASYGDNQDNLNAYIGQRAGTTDVRGYRRLIFRIDGKNVQYYEHRLIWFYVTGAWPKQQIDHIDRNPSNNAWNNLRDVSHMENQMNRSKGQKGIVKRPRKKIL